MSMLAFAGMFAGGLLVRELSLMHGWFERRTVLYHAAEQAARRRHKPLLVIGRPRGRAHGCGDVTVDIDRAVLTECPHGVVADARNLSMFADRQFGAVYVGGVFEAVPGNLRQAIREATRVADEVFVNHIDPDSFSAEFHPETRSVIYSAPPITPYVTWREHGSDKIETQLVRAMP